MLDAVFTFAFQHYVIFGIVALCVGVILNLIVTAAPEIVQQVRTNKLL